MLWASIWSFFALPPWMAFMERAWPSTKALPSRAQRSASQVPREAAFDAHDEIVPVGRHGLEKWFGSCLHVSVQHKLTVLIQDTERHGAGVPVATTVKFVWCSVESPEVSSYSLAHFLRANIPWWYAEEEASISIKQMQLTSGSAARSMAGASGIITGCFVPRPAALPLATDL
jgi:hypothetical protein